MPELPLIQRFCVVCGTLFEVKANLLTRVCSQECGLAERPAREVKVSTGTIGAISELIAAQDLLSKGLGVFRSMSPSCTCDLVAMFGRQLYRVEVTTARRTAKNRITHAKGETERFKWDILACVIFPDGEVYYEVQRASVGLKQMLRNIAVRGE